MQNTTLIVTRDISYPGGTEIFVIKLASYLLANNIQPIIVQTDGHNQFQNDVYSSLESEGVVIETLQNHSLDFWAPQKASDLVTLIKRYNPTTVFTILFNADFIAYQAKVGTEKVLSYLKEVNTFDRFGIQFPDSIEDMLNTPTNGYQFKWISSKFCDFSIALEVDTPEWASRKDYVDNNLESIVSDAADLVWGVSNQVVTKWCNVTTSKVDRLPGIALGSADVNLLKSLRMQKEFLQEKHGFIAEGKIWTSLGRIVPGKGIEEMVISFQKYLLEYPKDKLFIIGTGTLLEEYKEKYGGIEGIVFIGRQDHDIVLEMLCASDYFVMFSESEGLPLVIQEAMAAGNPVLATDIPGNNELIQDGETGFLVELNNLDDYLAGYMKLRKLSEEKYEQFANRSVERIEKEFSLDIAFKMFLREINNEG